MTQIKAKTRIFLIANANKPGADQLLAHLAEWLETQGLLVGTDLNGNPQSINRAEPDYVITLGGDGTILYAAQAMQHRQVPIIGVNLGKLGYLADFETSELQQYFDEILSNPQFISKRMMFNVRIVAPDGISDEGVAINDCVIRVGDPFRTISMSIRIDEQPLCTLTSDGVILATPTGSTAHNLSCGGPIVEPDVDAIILTPKCPHSFTHRPVVISPDSNVCIQVHFTSVGHNGAAVVLDGQSVHYVVSDSCIYVSKAKECFQLVRNPKRRPWDTLITKLKWGQDVT